jgi:hypothetical protein
MRSGLRHRFWLESIPGSVAGLAAIITVLRHDWIEVVSGMDPDRGNGAAEWLVVSVLLALTVALAAGARHEWRRARLSAR